ncbi:hypothetical protein BDW72DRAFT_206643 [Aspergillus terricola var. indicus]
MRPTYLYLPIGLLIPRAIYCDAQHESLEAREDIEALANLKYLVDFTSSLASLIEDKNDASPSPGPAQPAFAFEQGPELHEEATRHKDDKSIVGSLALMEAESMDDALPNDVENTPASMPLVDSVVCSHTNADANMDANANGARDILQQFAVTAEALRSGESDSDEHRLAPAQDDSIAGRAGARAGSSLLKECPHPESGLEALRQLTSLVQPESTKSTHNRPPSASERPLSQAAGKKSRSRSTARPTARQKSAQPLAQPDILTRFEAIQRFSKLAKKLSVLNEFGSLSAPERIHRVISDPEVAPTVQWMFDNAGKSFIRSSPLVPDDTVLSPSLIKHYRNIKASFERLGADLVPWLMATFQPGYIRALNKQVTLWRQALATPEMARILDVVTDPATLDGISASMGRAKKALTAERRGFFDLKRDEYKAFGDVLGTNIKTHFATAEGISESQTINAIVVIMQKRSGPLTAGLTEDLHFFFDQVSSAAATVPGVLGPLLPPGNRDERTPARVSLSQGSALADLQSILDAGMRLTQPERLEELRLAISDLQRSESTSRYSISASEGFGGNASAGPAPVFEFPFVAGDEKISRLIQMLDARIAPGEVEKTRETLQFLSLMSDSVRYDAHINEMFNAWRDVFRPTLEDCAQLGNGYALYPAFGKHHPLSPSSACSVLCANKLGRFAVEEGSSPGSGSGSAQGSPSSGSRLSAKAETFVPGVDAGTRAGAGAQLRTLGESLYSTSTDSNHFSFVDSRDPIEPSPQARPAALFPRDPFASPHASIHSRWASIYIDPVHPRMGGGVLCALPAITAHANAHSSSNSEAVLAQHAPILLALVKDILRNHHPRSRTMIRVCTRQSYHLGEGRAVPTVLVTLDFEQDRSKAEAALPEILHLFRGKLDREYAEWMDDHLKRSIELDERLRVFQESRPSLGSMLDQSFGGDVDA